jgi:hypothetical protein
MLQQWGDVSICSFHAALEADKSCNSFQPATCGRIPKRRNASILESSAKLQAQVQMHAANAGRPKD